MNTENIKKHEKALSDLEIENSQANDQEYSKSKNVFSFIKKIQPYLFILPSIITLILFIFIPIFMAFLISFYEVDSTTGLLEVFNNFSQRASTTLRNFFYLDDEFKKGLLVVDGIKQLITYILVLVYTRFSYLKLNKKTSLKKEYNALLAILIGISIGPLTLLLLNLFMTYVPIIPRLNVPLKEYRTVLTSVELDFIRILFNTVFWTLICTFLHVTIGIFLAIILNQDFKGKTLFRGLFIIPWAIPSFISTLIWRTFIFDKQIGTLGSSAANYKPFTFQLINLLWLLAVVLLGLGVFYLWNKFITQKIDFREENMRKLKPLISSLFILLICFLCLKLFQFVNPLISLDSSFLAYKIIEVDDIRETFWISNNVNIFGIRFVMITFSAIIINTWLGVPFMMVSFLAALQSIPEDLYEAAEIDGTTSWQKFKKITFPLLKPTLFTVSLLGIIWTFNLFNVVYILSQGQNLGDSTDYDIFVTFIYGRFSRAEYSRAASLSFIVFIMLIIFSQAYKKFINVDKIWEGEE